MLNGPEYRRILGAWLLMLLCTVAWVCSLPAVADGCVAALPIVAPAPAGPAETAS
jgi:hypothetical protein